MKWYSIGTLSFPASWAAIAAAFVSVYVYLRLQRKKQAADLYSNAFFIFALTWKLSVILFQFQTAVKNPFSIVYFNGGLKGYWIGFAAAFLYLFFAARKSAILEKSLQMEVWILMITVYELVFYLLTKWHILLSSLQLIGSIAFFIWLRKKSAESVWSIQTLVLYLCFLGLIHSLAGNLFSVPMATYTAGSFMISWAAWKGSRKY